MSGLGRAVSRGAGWALGLGVLGSVGQIAYTAFTSRQIPPAAFGALATAQALVGLLGYFSLSSLGQSLQRSPRRDPPMHGTVFSLALAGGLLAGLCAVALAPLWAHVWQVAGAAQVVRILAIQMGLAPVGTVCVAQLRRDLRFRLASVIELAGQLIGFAVGVLLVARVHSVEALAWAQVIGTATTAALALPPAHLGRPRWSTAIAGEMVPFSLRVSLQNFGFFAVNTVPQWFAARLFGPAPLGQYSRANLLVGVPLTQVAAAFTRAAYPAYVHLRETDVFANALQRITIAVSGLGVLAFGVLAGSAPLVVRLLLGPRWATAAQLVPALCLGAVVTLIFTIWANALEFLARFPVVSRSQAILLVGTLTGLLIAWKLHSLQVLPWALTVGYLAGTAYVGRALIQSGHLARSWMGPWAAELVGAFAALAAGSRLVSNGLLGSGADELVAGVVILALVALWAWRYSVVAAATAAAGKLALSHRN